MSWSTEIDSRDLVQRAVERLGRAHAVTIAEALESVPSTPGLYAWWLTSPEALRTLPASSGPIYVGIAPSRAASRSSLRSRLRQHARGNIAGSTFRRSLAALLWAGEQWTPFVSPSGKLKLTAAHNRALTRWQEANLRVAWCATEAPWSLEAAVIAVLKPPLNLDDNEQHPFWGQMRSARALLAATARGSVQR